MSWFADAVALALTRTQPALSGPNRHSHRSHKPRPRARVAICVTCDLNPVSLQAFANASRGDGHRLSGIRAGVMSTSVISIAKM